MDRQTVEALWAGQFGTEYTVRNADQKNATIIRYDFWIPLQGKYGFMSALEVGCGDGKNLQWLADTPIPHWSLWGCDINPAAISDDFTMTIPGTTNLLVCPAHDTPFKDNYIDLVFTCGVLIHQGPDNYMGIVDEMFRVSKKYVLVMEYEWPQWEEIPYRDQPGALWKGPFKTEIAAKYGEPIDGGFLDKKDGFDRVTWSLFQKHNSSSAKAPMSSA